MRWEVVWETANRVRVAVRVLTGHPVVWRTEIRIRDDDVVQVRAIDPTDSLLFDRCVFRTEDGASVRVFLGDEKGMMWP